MRRGFFCIAIGVAFFIACGDATFQGGGDDTSQDGGSDASDASIDAPLLDSGGDAGGDSASGVPGNLLADPSFESTATAGCGVNWTLGTGSTTLTQASVGRTGSHSCLVCGIGNFGGVGTNPSVEPLAGLDAGLYQGSAWVMPIASDAGSASPFALPEFSQSFVDGGASGVSGSSFTTPVGQWTQVYFDMNLDSDKQLQFTIAVAPDTTTTNTGCALIDDFSLVAE